MCKSKILFLCLSLFVIYSSELATTSSVGEPPSAAASAAVAAAGTESGPGAELGSTRLTVDPTAGVSCAGVDSLGSSLLGDRRLGC